VRRVLEWVAASATVVGSVACCDVDQWFPFTASHFQALHIHNCGHWSRTLSGSVSNSHSPSRSSGGGGGIAACRVAASTRLVRDGTTAKIMASPPPTQRKRENSKVSTFVCVVFWCTSRRRSSAAGRNLATRACPDALALTVHKTVLCVSCHEVLAVAVGVCVRIGRLASGRRDSMGVTLVHA
jgi:hypothetical protein